MKGIINQGIQELNIAQFIDMTPFILETELMEFAEPRQCGNNRFRDFCKDLRS